MSLDEKYMARCLSLARGGVENVFPNPMVGSVIVYNDCIIGEGFHRKYGEAHAEVNAIHSVKDLSLLKKATLYVNLEPCFHYGKTPPCAELILTTGIPRVVIACLDPYPEVAGRGVKLLKSAGVDVTVGILEEEAWELNRKFMICHTEHRPYIHLKWAQSLDGFIDKKRINSSVPPVNLSSSLQQQRVHKLRAEVSAIMVGTRTALLDNPSLTVRLWSGQSPVRIVLDKDLRIPPDYHLLDTSVKTLIFTNQQRESLKNIEYIKIDFQTDVIPQVLKVLYENKLYSLLVEGGACLLNGFLEKNLWDEIQIETAPLYLKEGVEAPWIGH